MWLKGKHLACSQHFGPCAFLWHETTESGRTVAANPDVGASCLVAWQVASAVVMMFWCLSTWELHGLGWIRWNLRSIDTKHVHWHLLLCSRRSRAHSTPAVDDEARLEFAGRCGGYRKCHLEHMRSNSCSEFDLIRRWGNNHHSRHLLDLQKDCPIWFPDGVKCQTLFFTSGWRWCGGTTMESSSCWKSKEFGWKTPWNSASVGGSV